jgi:hypothetical protein
LRRFGASEATVALLQPYLGVRGQPALTLVTNNPLSLPENIAISLSQGAYSAAQQRATSQWNSLSATDFSYLPTEVQTVMVDIAYQLYSITSPVLPSGFIANAKTGYWEVAANLLANWSVDPRRGANNANLINTAIQSNEVSPAPTAGCS